MPFPFTALPVWHEHPNAAVFDTMAVETFSKHARLLILCVGQVLVQEFLVGTEYVVDTVSRDGEHKVCMIFLST